MAGDGRIAGVGQAEFDDAGARPLRAFPVRVEREEAVQHDAFDVLARERGAAAGADQARAGAEQGDAHLVRRAGRQQLFLGGAAAFGQLGKAGGGQACRGALGRPG